MIAMKLEQEASEWGATKSNDLKLCIIGAWTHVGYNLLSSILDGSIFSDGERSYDIDIYLYDVYVHLYTSINLQCCTT